jgi:acyl carrier protein
MTDDTRYASARDELRAAMRDWGMRDVDALDDDAPLISAGRLDSVALFSLSLWLEARRGAPIDPSTIDITTAWDSIAKILAFAGIARPSAAGVARGTRAPPPAAAALPEPYRIVRYSPEYRDAVVTLQKRLWSSDTALNARFFDWRYANDIDPASALVYLGTCDGAVVAMRAVHAERWESGPARTAFDLHFVDDLVVLPGHESRGLFAAFTAQLREDLAARHVQAFVSMSALRVTRIQALAGGARGIGVVQALGLTTTASAFMDEARSIAARLPVAWRLADKVTPSERASAAFQRADAAETRTHGAIELRIFARAPAQDMATLVASLPHDGRLRRVRDAEYFVWRYANPLHDYRVACAYEQGALAGYLVFERSLSDLANQRRMHIADWEARDERVAAALLDHVIAAAQPAELVTWSECSSNSQRTLLAARGFRDIDIEQRQRGLPSVLVWPIQSSELPVANLAGDRSLERLADWDLRLSDTSYA